MKYHDLLDDVHSVAEEIDEFARRQQIVRLLHRDLHQKLVFQHNVDLSSVYTSSKFVYNAIFGKFMILCLLNFVSLNFVSFLNFVSLFSSPENETKLRRRVFSIFRLQNNQI